MESRTQFSIFLTNKPGTLSRVFQELSKAKVNISALAMMDSMEHGVLRMTVGTPASARRVLKKTNIPFTEHEVLAVELPNRPGAAADLCDKLATKHINIGYMYCTGGTPRGKTLTVLRVPDIKKAIKVLENSKGTRRDMKVKLRRPATRTKKRK